ncbi:MAG: endonuclease/exonuclease/phosphatase family protein [Jiangellaceae bacterium]|nr:endonuclease/exonuclease/phosphatase family protein [Jiangellaceae bacterium]
MPLLRVVSYNVRSLHDDRAALVRVVRRLEPDVLCLQEAPRRLRWRAQCAALARDCGLLYVGGGGTTGGAAMLAAVRVDVRGTAEYSFSRTPNMQPRGATAAWVGVVGARAVVVSTHLGLDADERARHQRELVGFVDRFAARVTVIAADVNESPHEPTWRALAAEFADAGQADGTPTFSTRNPRRRIDGVFVRGPADVVAHRVPVDDDVLVASDHRPVVADLDLPTQPV